ncbi:uncharacterized protein FTOL_08656 [Fusarium torulosum]|uniref:Protein kinase domain-containing protein n=1 Tax=Fusarium torulosum TaxID=33205 RepID=A0AAE8MCY9_9HYPO|nr:uncharacterized protein FTOL_08656 [Fusarium torulosum]
MALADLLRQTLENLDSGQQLSDKIRKGGQGSVIGPLDYNGQKVAMKIFDYTDQPDVARTIRDFEREYQSLKALSHPSIIRFVAFDHVPAMNSAYLRMQWASTELSDNESGGAVDLGDIICHHDGLHSQRRKSFLPETFIWHVLFHLSAALSLCHYGIKIQRKKIAEKTNAQTVLSRLIKNPPPDLRDLAAQHPKITWTTERITFLVNTSHESIIHRDIKPRNVLLCDPAWNDYDENWRTNVSLEKDGIFCVYPVVLLGDFGLSAPLRGATTIRIGSYGFTAPEIPQGSCRPDNPPFEWTTSCDIFSLGATAWSLMSLQTPPNSFRDCGLLPELPISYSPELRNLVLQCSARDQSARPTAVDILDECIQRGYWNETLVSPYGTIISSNFHTALQQSWRDCLEQLNLVRKSKTLVNQAPALVDDILAFMKLDQQDKYGKFAIFIAGAYFMRNFVYNPHFLVPLQRTSRFVGRQDVFRRLHSRMNSNSNSLVVLSLYGMGGIGKTQVAIQFAHQVMEQDTGISVFWVNGASLSAVQESYYQIAVACNILSRERMDSLFMSRVKRWLESESAGRWLMIVDNVDDADMFLKTENNTYPPPLSHIPKCTHGTILYTTRHLEFAKQVSSSKDIIQITKFTELEATTLLSEMIPSATKSGSPYDLARLSDTLGHHPLAISQAAAFMNSYDLSVSEYLTYLKDQQTAGRILKFETTDLTRDKGWESLYSTWKISFDRIQGRNPLAANVLALMSFFHPDTIPVSLLAQEFTDKLSLSEAISLLRDMSLISPHNEGRAYAIHRLIQICTENWLESQGSRQHFLSMSLHLLARLFPEDQYDNWEAASVLLPHAIKVLSLKRVSDKSSLARAELLEKVSQYELKLGRLQDTEQFAREAFQIRSNLHGSTATDTVRCQAHVARVLWALGKYHAARELAFEAFTVSQTIDPRSPDTLASMDIFANVLDSLGKYEEAEEMHRQILKLRKNGKYEDAEHIHRQTLELREKELGKDHPDTLTSINNLANVLDNQGEYEEAEQMHRQTLRLREKVLSKDHPDILASMNNLANVLYHQGKYEDAEQIHRQTLELRVKMLGNDHPDTLASMNNLAHMLDNQGKYEEAEQMHRQTLQLKEKVLGKDHPDKLISIDNLANVLDNQGKYEEAEQMHRQTLELRVKMLGKDHPDTLASMNNLAHVLDNQGKYEDAEQIHRQTLELRAKMLGKDHPDTLASMNNLANMLYHQGKYEEAEQMHRQTLGLREKMLGKDHPDTLTSMNNLANVLDNQGEYEEAEQMHRQTLRLREKVLSKDHPDILASMNNLANVLYHQGKYEDAEQIHRQTLELRAKMLGKDHPDTLASMNNLAMCSLQARTTFE